jgi:hypothetical protein
MEGRNNTAASIGVRIWAPGPRQGECFGAPPIKKLRQKKVTFLEANFTFAMTVRFCWVKYLNYSIIAVSHLLRDVL